MVLYVEKEPCVTAKPDIQPSEDIHANEEIPSHVEPSRVEPFADATEQPSNDNENNANLLSLGVPLVPYGSSLGLGAWNFRRNNK